MSIGQRLAEFVMIWFSVKNIWTLWVDKELKGVSSASIFAFTIFSIYFGAYYLAITSTIWWIEGLYYASKKKNAPGVGLRQTARKALSKIVLVPFSSEVQSQDEDD